LKKNIINHTNQNILDGQEISLHHDGRYRFDMKYFINIVPMVDFFGDTITGIT